jgi:hypothetical protein
MTVVLIPSANVQDRSRRRQQGLTLEHAAGAIIATATLRSEMKPAPQLAARARLLMDSTAHAACPPGRAPAGSLPDRYQKRDLIATSPFYTSEVAGP